MYIAIGLLSLCAALLPAQGSASRPATIYTTHFFDWYRVTEQQPYEAMQRVFTFRPDWESVGLQPSEVGVSQRYYSVQFRMIQQAGFDGIHYEWFGAQPSDPCVAALRETRTKVAMFYDQEIRFQGTPMFIKPTDEFRNRLVTDVTSFYQRIPQELWLSEADGSLPIIFYAYQFDQSYRGADLWHRFYRQLLDDLRERLGKPIRIYWTDSGTLCQTYAFQHFPEISSYSFGWWGGQRQINAQSVTFVVHYDDKGAVVGGRAARNASFDPRFLEEDLALARMASPRLVFNYGWNEYYEGENIFPDRTWGRWRLETMSAIVRALRQGPRLALPPAVLLMDDLYKGDLLQPGSRQDEHALSGAFRFLFPQAESRLGMDLTNLPPGKPITLAIARNRTDGEEAQLLRLADSGRARVVFFEPDPAHVGPLARRFMTGKASRPLEQVPPPPTNQWVGAVIPVQVEAARYPILRIRVRNSLNTYYHVRVIGTDTEGNSHENHDNNSPLDWKTSGGGWESRKENVKSILEAYSGKTIVRFTGLVVIVNATNFPGDFTADFADAEFCDEQGNVGLRVPLGDLDTVQYRASFTNSDIAGYPWGKIETGPEGKQSLRLLLKARFTSGLMLDASTRHFQPTKGTRILAQSTWPPLQFATKNTPRLTVPIVLQRGDLFWVNTFSIHQGVYGPLMKALGMPPVRTADHLQFQQVKSSTVVQRTSTVTILPREPLPVERIRLYHPADLSMKAIYPWPASSVPLAAERIDGAARRKLAVSTVATGNRLEISGGITLRPGDVVDVYRVPVVIASPKRVAVSAVRQANGTFTLRLAGSGTASVKPTRPSVTVLKNGRPTGNRVVLPAELQVIAKSAASNP